MANIIYLSTKMGRNGGAWYLVINTQSKRYNLSQNGTWNKYAYMQSKKALLDVVDQLKQNGFTSFDFIDDCYKVQEATQ